jgi:hypothetical protein
MSLPEAACYRWRRRRHLTSDDRIGATSASDLSAIIESGWLFSSVAFSFRIVRASLGEPAFCESLDLSIRYRARRARPRVHTTLHLKSTD